MLNNRAPSEDRRKTPRIKTVCRCWLERESITLLGTVTNVSTGGVFIRTPVSLDTGMDVNITLTLDEGHVMARGRVAWVNGQFKGLAAPGLGITFDEVFGGRDLLQLYVKEKTPRV